MVRVIASIVGILLLIPVVIFSHTIVLNCALALISMIAVYECLTIMKFPEKKQLLLPGILVAGVLPFCEYFDGQKFLMTVVFLYLAYLFLCKVLRPDTDLVHLICCAFMTFFVPYPVRAAAGGGPPLYDDHLFRGLGHGYFCL